MTREQEEFIAVHGLTEEEFFGFDKFDKLHLDGSTNIPDGFTPNVDGDLDLRLIKKIGNGFAPRVGRTLYLNSAESLGDGFAPQVGWSLMLDSLERLPRGFAPYVGESLYIQSIRKFGLGEDIDLSGVQSNIYMKGLIADRMGTLIEGVGFGKYLTLLNKKGLI
jgi:hypothetical protein